MNAINQGEPSLIDLLIAVNRLQASVEAYTAQAARSDEVQRTMQVEVAGLRDRVVAIESSRKASPPWWVVLGALASIATVITVIGLFADRLYSK